MTQYVRNRVTVAEIGAFAVNRMVLAVNVPSLSA
jgi:hypothetical protein